MKKEQIEVVIKKMIIDQFSLNVDKLPENYSLVNDLGADSLDGVELVMCLEDKFKIEISNEDAQDFLTVRNIIDYICMRTGDENE